MMDKSSPEFLFGQIMARLSEGDRTIASLSGEVKGVREVLRQLPCTSHNERLNNIEKCQEKKNKRMEKGEDARLNLKHGLIIALSAAAAAAGFSALFAGLALR